MSGLVTGGTGFLGSHLVRRLLSDGWDVAVMARPSSDVRRIQHELGSIRLLYADLLERDSLVQLAGLDHIDVVFHLAAVGLHERTPRPAYEVVKTNVMGTLNALMVADESGIARVVHCGTGLEYGAGSLLSESALLRPASVYASSKAAAWLLAESLCRERSIELVSVRPFTVYGPDDSEWSLVGSLVKAAIDGAELDLTEGRQRRDFVFVEDVVEALLAAATVPSLDGEVFNISTGCETSVRAAAELVLELADGEGGVAFGARPYRAHELWESSGDPSKARDRLQWSAATSLRDGLARTISYERRRCGKIERPESLQNKQGS